MELFHTSPEAITKISRSGLFDSFLCFSGRAYQMSASDVRIYSIEQNDANLIEASELFYHEDASKLDPIIAKVAARFSCSEEEAVELLSEQASSYDFGGDADDSFWMQLQTAKCAKTLGFDGCVMQDEQGSLYMIDMLGREAELQIH